MTDVNENPTDDPALDIHDEAEVKAIEDFDYARVGLLLDIVQKVANVTPKATSLSGIALAEIDILNERAKDIARARAEKVRQAEQRRFDAEREQMAEDAQKAREEQVDARPGRARSIPANPQPAPSPAPGEPSPTRRL